MNLNLLKNLNRPLNFFKGRKLLHTPRELHAGRRLRQMLFFIELAVISTAIVVAPIANALQMQIRDDIAFRSSTSGSKLHKMGLLKAGSIVDIPDSYAVNGVDGAPNVELTLNHWLAQTGFDHASINSATGGETSDFFFPVHVVRAKEGSDTAALNNNGTYYVAMRSLLRQNGILVTHEDAPVFPPSDFKPVVSNNHVVDRTASPPPEVTERGADTDTDTDTGPMDPATLESESGCPTGNCTSTPEPQFQKLMKLLSRPLQEVDRTQGSYANRTNYSLKTVGPRFFKECGIKIRDFIPELVRQSMASDIPPEFMLSMMIQESEGNCHSVSKETNSTVSVGLFQINSNSSTIPRCTDAQKVSLHQLTADTMGKGPRCLENPTTNLSEAIRLLKAKLNVLTSREIKVGNQMMTVFDPKSLQTNGKFNMNAWRLAFSAYNGGERWVLQAKADLDAFNLKQGTHLQASNWESLRVFYLRGWLSRDPRTPANAGPEANVNTEMFGNQATTRDRQNSRANLAWIENIVPRDPPFRKSDRPNMTEAWRVAINP